MTTDKNEIANTAQTENIVKRILSSEVKYLIGVVLFLAGVVAPYYEIKTEIALIKQNHYAHIEAMTKQIEQNSNDILKIQESQFEIVKTLAVQNSQILELNKNK
jgi:hypothetical protein